MPYNGEQVTCYFGDMSLKCNYAITFITLYFAELSDTDYSYR